MTISGDAGPDPRERGTVARYASEYGVSAMVDGLIGLVRSAAADEHGVNGPSAATPTATVRSGRRDGEVDVLASHLAGTPATRRSIPGRVRRMTGALAVRLPVLRCRERRVPVDFGACGRSPRD